MNTVRTIQKVCGPNVTIAVPPELAGQEVEIVIQSVAEPPVSENARLARFIRPKPPLTEEDKKLFEQDRYPLRNAGGWYNDPFEPAVPAEDWEVYEEDPRVKPHDPA